jgi:hypothetical protein
MLFMKRVRSHGFATQQMGSKIYWHEYTTVSTVSRAIKKIKTRRYEMEIKIGNKKKN